MTATRRETGPGTPRIYSALLYAYPRRWRANGRGDELIAVLLDSAAAIGRTRPTLRESLDVVLRGLAERVRAADVVLPPDSRRHLAQASLAMGSALSAFLILGGEVRVRGFSDGSSPSHLDLWLRNSWDPFLTLDVAVYCAWLIAMIRYVGGSVRGSREFALIAGAIALSSPELSELTNHQRAPGGMVATLAILALGAALLPPDSVLTRRRRLGPLITAFVLTVALVVWRVRDLATSAHDPELTRAVRSSRTMFYWDPSGDRLQINRAIAPGLTALVLVGVAAALLAWFWDRTWLPAAAFLIVPVLTLRLGTSLFSPAHSTRNAVMWSGAVIGLVAVHGVVVTRILRLPWQRSTRPPLQQRPRDRQLVG